MIKQEVLRRLCQLLGLSPQEVWLDFDLQAAFRDLEARARSPIGDFQIQELVDSPGKLAQISKLALVREVRLWKTGKDMPLRLRVADAIFSPEVPMKEQMNDGLRALIPFATALKASLFVISFEGVYLDYFEAGHEGPTITPYDQMIGRTAMDNLPEPMQSQVKYHFYEAVRTGQPQEYCYTSPLSGREMRSLAIPYPEFNQLALLVMDAASVRVPIPV